MSKFKFDLTQSVNIIDDSMAGKVVARAEHLDSENEYLIEIPHDGEFIHSWAVESSIKTLISEAS